MSMTTTDIVESCTIQEDMSPRCSLQMKVESIGAYYDNKSISQLRKYKIKRRKGSPYALGVHLQLKDPEVCQDIPLLKDNDPSSSVARSNGSRFYHNFLYVEPIQPKELSYEDSRVN